MVRLKDQKRIKEGIRDYYGKVLSRTSDLKTSACCAAGSLDIVHQEIVKEIDNEIVTKFYGCGSPIPSALTGCTILDLGCGTGRDVYIASKLVGPNGYVIGVDMTDEQLDVARRKVEYQRKRYGFKKTNVRFIKGEMEDLKSLGISDNSIDIVISNCVLNLSLDKERVFSEIFRVLKPGGELYFSDTYADRRVPVQLKNDSVLMGECLSGALYLEDFRRILSGIGFPDYRIVSIVPIAIEYEELKKRLGDIEFYSATIRVFKLEDSEDLCEDYGQKALYKGTVTGSPDYFTLDNHHTFPTNKAVRICGNTASILSKTRFADHFKVIGDRAVHYGLFDCSNNSRGKSTLEPTTDKGVVGIRRACC